MRKYPAYSVGVASSSTFGVINRIEVNWDHLIRRREFILRDLDDFEFNYLLLPEVERLLSSIEDGTTHLAAYTLWVTGARVSELLTLRPMDFDLSGEAFVSLPALKNRTPKKQRPPGAFSACMTAITWRRYGDTSKLIESRRMARYSV